ncbi:hypothetical protein Ndes2526B_g02580 [Nannochloris sp. 'desiccata']
MTSMDPSSQIESPSAAVAAIIDLLAAPRPWDLPATSRQLRKLLKAMQHSLQQNRTSASSDSRLVPCLQSLLHFGWDAEEKEGQLQSSVQKCTSSPASPIKNKYIPPGARQQQQQQSIFSLSHAQSSDSEGASDAENGSGLATDIKLSRVRFLALACLQSLIKSDAKAMHPLWPLLLPEPDSDLSSKAAVLSKSGTNTSPLTLAHPLHLDSSARVRHAAAVTLGTLLEGPAQRAYLAVAELANASASPQTQKQARVRGFVPLSATLGSIVVGTHAALLRALTTEQDNAVLVAILRALGTALVGTPYSRLPSPLLPNCVDTIRKILQKAQQQAQQHDSPNPPSASASTLQLTAVPLLSSSLACLAAALGAKPPLASLSEYLSNKNGLDLAQEIFACIMQYGNLPAVQLEALMALRGLTQQYHGAVGHMWGSMLHFASSSVQAASRSSLGNDGSTIIHTKNNAPTSGGIGEGGSSSREKVIQQSILLLGDYLCHSSNKKKDTMRHRTSSNSNSTDANDELELKTEASKLEKKWNDAVEMCISPVIARQDSPLLQAAGFGFVAIGLGGLSLNRQVSKNCADPAKSSSSFLSREMRADLLAKCSNVLLPDNVSLGREAGGGGGAGTLVASSPVRAAAAKAMASLIAAIPLSHEPLAFVDALPSLLTACQDSVVAVRVQAAAALAAAAEALYHLSQNIDTEQQQQLDIQLLRSDALTALVPAAVSAAMDGDKVKPSGVQALGTFLACRQLTTTEAQHAEQTAESRSILLEEEKNAFIACISSENAKVQWSACTAAGTFLRALKSNKNVGTNGKTSSQEGDGDSFKDAVSDAEVAGDVQELVEALQLVASEGRNTRSRALALAALAHCD